MLIGDLVTRCATQPHIGRRTAILFKDRVYTWTQVNEAVNSLAHALQEMGVTKGDRIALIMRNSDAIILAEYALSKIAVVCPINYLISKKEMAYILNDSDAKILIISNNLLHNIAHIKAECSKLEKIIVYSQDGSAVPEEYINFDDLITNYSKEEPTPSEPLDDRELAYLMYTGGTTGLPKGVMLSHHNLIINSLTSLATYTIKIDQDENLVLLALPIFHAAANIGVIQAILVGNTMVVLDGFVISKFLETMVKYKCIGFGLVPTMLNLLINSPEIKNYRDYLPNIKLIIYGASPIAPSVLRQAIETFPNADVFQFFGQTEYSPVITVMDSLDHENALLPGNEYLLSSAGRAMGGTDVKIVDMDGKEVPVGEIGEIICRGDSTMLGYWKQPEKTAQTIKEGWLFTGDMGRMDEDGYIFIMDRRKDMIISGGENIYTKEVEDALYTHPAVLECAVIGIPDDRWGEAVHAIVVLQRGYKKGDNVTEEELIAHVKDQIARYKAPKSIKFKRDLPKSAQGKILKKNLRKKHWGGRERRVS